VRGWIKLTKGRGVIEREKEREKTTFE